MMRWLISGIGFLVLTSIPSLALAQSCPQSTFTINSTLANFNKSQTSTVAYAWTGAHYTGGGWADRKNPGDIITYNANGAAVSQNFTSSFSHGATSDSSTALASAQCNDLPSCSTASLTASACVTSKVDSAGAGAYARAGTVVPPKAGAAKTGTVTIFIPNRMTLTSNVGDEVGVWGIAVTMEKGKKNLVDKGHPDVAPFLVDLLGLKYAKDFKVHSDKQKIEIFTAGFELDPSGHDVKLIGPSAVGFDVNENTAVGTTLRKLRKRFQIEPCKTVDKDGKTQANEKCHVAEYRLQDGEQIKMEIPYELPEEPQESAEDQILNVELGIGGRDSVQTHGGGGQQPGNPGLNQ